MKNKYGRTRLACYYTYLAMSSVFSLPPILFMTFRETYGISYTLLGTLVLVNFCTQFLVDMVFTLFAKHFNIRTTLKIMPLLTTTGLVIYAIVPTFLPQFAYAGLVTGTLIFSVAAGLCEVLLSPTIAAMPSDNPDRDMSLLHSLYAWGVVSVVIISTLFLNIFGTENWMYLTLFFALLPLVSSYLFSTSPLPEINMTSNNGTAGRTKKYTLILGMCVACIFLGAAAENVMTNWISGFTEKALGIPKAYVDVVGLALFATFLGTVRTLYAKYGKNISRVLFFGMMGAAACYIIVAFCNNSVVVLCACLMTGAFTSMLWPGSLILMEEKLPCPGVAAYALMAAGGDFGSSVAPQLMGITVDAVSGTRLAEEVSRQLNITPEQVGMKAGMLVTAIFPIIGIFVVIILATKFKNAKKQ